MRIKCWIFSIRRGLELIPRSTIAIQNDPNMIDKLSKNITFSGLTRETLTFLKYCAILEPMQELMSRSKTYGLTPRDSLKTVVQTKWQRFNSSNINATTSINHQNNNNNNNNNSILANSSSQSNVINANGEFYLIKNYFSLK